MTTDERFDRVDASIERLTKYIVDLREETSGRLRVIESRLDVFAATLTSIDSRLPALTKAVIETGALFSQLTLDQSKQKASISEFAGRLAKLEETVAKLLQPAA